MPEAMIPAPSKIELSTKYIWEDFAPSIGNIVLIGSQEIYLPDAFDSMMERKKTMHERIQGWIEERKHIAKPAGH